VLELNGCNPKLLNDVKRVEEIMVSAAKLAKATIVGTHFHQFSPFGISGVVVIAVHTWPEHGYAAVDIFTCGETLTPEVAAQYLVQKFQARQPSLIELKRGLIPDSKPAKVASAKVAKVGQEVFAYGPPKELQVVS